MKTEALAVLLLGVLVLLLGSPSPASSFARLGTNEVFLAFALVFTFVAGIEVINPDGLLKKIGQSGGMINTKVCKNEIVYRVMEK